MNTPANSLIGKPLNRTDGRAKVTGAALYTADQPIRGVLHAVMVASTIAAGRVLQVDDEAAKNMRGVIAVLTPANAEKLPGLWIFYILHP